MMIDEFQPTLKQLLAFQDRNGLSILLTPDEIKEYIRMPEFRRIYVPAELQPYEEYHTVRLIFEIDGREERLQVEIRPQGRAEGG